jgi:hypothetical protein
LLGLFKPACSVWSKQISQTPVLIDEVILIDPLTETAGRGVRPDCSENFSWCGPNSRYRVYSMLFRQVLSKILVKRKQWCVEQCVKKTPTFPQMLFFQIWSVGFNAHACGKWLTPAI